MATSSPRSRCSPLEEHRPAELGGVVDGGVEHFFSHGSITWFRVRSGKAPLGQSVRPRARTLHGRRALIATKLLALAAGVWLNHDIDQPTRSFAAPAA